MDIDRAVILARGVGLRMRRSDPTAALDPRQAAAADRGVKAMIPVGRPFLDYLLSVLADAGYRRVCLVLGPEHDEVRSYYAAIKPRRLQIEFAVQAAPLGTADAVAAAAPVVGRDAFLMINSDNYYPLEPLVALRAAAGPAVAAFDRDAMVRGSNIPAERLSKFAAVEVDSEGWLRRIIEKPSEPVLARLPRPLGIGMNCWRFGESIFEACRSIGPSPRGELEITDAVQYSIDRLGERFAVVWSDAAVLDLSTRSDIKPVAARLAGAEVQL